MPLFCSMTERKKNGFVSSSTPFSFGFVFSTRYHRPNYVPFKIHIKRSVSSFLVNLGDTHCTSTNSRIFFYGTIFSEILLCVLVKSKKSGCLHLHIQVWPVTTWDRIYIYVYYKPVVLNKIVSLVYAYYDKTCQFPQLFIDFYFYFQGRV